jgi:hypothetical protein
MPLRNFSAIPVYLAFAQLLLAPLSAVWALRQLPHRWWATAPLSAVIWAAVVLPITQYAQAQFDAPLAGAVALVWSFTAFPAALRYAYKWLTAESPPNTSFERTREG